jgi:hypothetical protein
MNLGACCDKICSNGKSKSIGVIIQKLMLGAIVYFIWQERNLRLFQNKNRNVEDLCNQIIEIVRLKLLGLKIKNSLKTVLLSKVWGFKVYDRKTDSNNVHDA